MPNKKLLFDTVVLSNFAFVPGGILFLKKKYGERGAVTFQVMQEIAKAVHAGMSDLEEIEKNLFQKKGFQKISMIEEEQIQYIPLLRNLGEGEASCIAVALQRKGIVVTDDRMARNFCKELNIPVTGTIGILKTAHLDGLLQIDDADRMLKHMIKAGFYSPVQRISDIL